MPRPTVKDLLALKGKRQLTEVFVNTPEEARACSSAGIDLLVCMEGADVRGIRSSAPDAFLTIAVSHSEHVTVEQAIRASYRALERGGDAVYLGHSIATVQQVAREGIPVVGHVGLIPYKNTWFGGFKAVGKTADEAVKLYQRALAYQQAGAFCIEMELVPSAVAAEISRRVKMLVLSMGSGSGCDGQYLFATDILGTNRGHVPRHAKVYRDLASEYDRLYFESVAAFSEFRSDVQSGTYPALEHQISGKDEEVQKFLEALERLPERFEPGEYL